MDLKNVTAESLRRRMDQVKNFDKELENILSQIVAVNPADEKPSLSFLYLPSNIKQELEKRGFKVSCRTRLISICRYESIYIVSW